MSTDPFAEVAADLQRLREIQSNSGSSPSTSAKEEARLLRVELQRRDAAKTHLQSLVSFHQKQERH